MPARPSIFLSHNSKDKPFARRLGQSLSSAGAQVWIDEAEIKLGDSLIRKISDGITGCDYLGVVLSPDSVASEWVKREVEIAMTREIAGRRVIVLPLLYKDCQIPPFLTDKLYADFTASAEFHESLNLILERLGLALTPTGLSEMQAAADLIHQIKAPLTMARMRLNHLMHQRSADTELANGMAQLSSLIDRTEAHISVFRLMHYTPGTYPLRLEQSQSLNGIVNRALSGIRPLAHRHSLTERLGSDSRVTCDPKLMEVALSSVLDNAIKYSFPDSPIIISTSTSPSLVGISVENTGLPISADDADHIFSKGFRGLQARYVTGEGGGIGLYITRQIMLAHGGDITFRV